VVYQPQQVPHHFSGEPLASLEGENAGPLEHGDLTCGQILRAHTSCKIPRTLQGTLVPCHPSSRRRCTASQTITIEVGFRQSRKKGYCMLQYLGLRPTVLLHCTTPPLSLTTRPQIRTYIHSELLQSERISEACLTRNTLPKHVGHTDTREPRTWTIPHSTPISFQGKLTSRIHHNP
jgi:hypothetical protein